VTSQTIKSPGFHRVSTLSSALGLAKVYASGATPSVFHYI